MYRQDTQEAGSVVVRPAVYHDIEAIGDLWVELMSFHATLDPRFTIPSHGRHHYIRHTQNALRDDNFVVLVATWRERVVGYLLGYIGQNPPIFPQQRYGFIADVCVTHACRRRQAGERLVQHACRWFREHGLQSIQLNVAHHNSISQAFWRKMGCMDYLDHMWMDLDRCNTAGK